MIIEYITPEVIDLLHTLLLVVLLWRVIKLERRK